MTYTGTIKGNVIEFGQQLPFSDGVQVVVDISPPPPLRKGSPQAWLTYFAGTLSADEAELILTGANECRTIDHALWSSSDS
ncbi:MAG: hypothetical protein GY801_26080 [bacterium]|nr:hypothetical protein [bacterium]